jgi:hypothetical protein
MRETVDKKMTNPAHRAAFFGPCNKLINYQFKIIANFPRTVKLALGICELSDNAMGQAMTSSSCDYAAGRMAGDRSPARECLVTGGTECDGNVVISTAKKTSAMWQWVQPKH